MKRVIPLVLFFIFIIASNGNAQDIIQKGELVNLERCIEIALMKNPSIIAAKSTVNVNESRVGEARSNYYPQVNWTSGYSRISPVSTIRSSANGSTTSFSGTSGGAFNQYSSSVGLTQNIFDFGKTPTQVKIQNLNFDSSLSDLENVSQQVILNVKQAYFRVIQAKYNRNVTEDTVKQTQQHLEQAKGFFEVGTRPKFDVTKAEVDLSNAKLNLIRAENAFRLAVVNLNNAMGVPHAPEYTLYEGALPFQKYEITFENAIAKAYENRPDIKSIVAKRQAAERSVDLAKTGYYPVLAGNAAYIWSGENFPLDHGWNVGVTLSFPLFSGFLTKYQVDEARANLNVLRANEETVRQTIVLDVQQAYLNLREAEERVPTAQLGVQQAQENLDIANGRYAAGVGNPIEVTDAEVALNNARLAHIQALYDYKVAQASLEKAMGTR